MSSLHPARRSAERFDALLEGEPGRQPSRPRDAELLELVGALAVGLPRAEARPEFVADLRERLMLAAETELVVPDSPAAPDRPAHRPPRAYAARAPPRRRPRRLRHRRRHHLDGRGRPERPARRRALPGQAGHRERRGRLQRQRRRPRARTILDNASGRLDEVDRLDPAGRRSTPPPSPQTLDRLHRPGDRGLRAAARRLRGHRLRGLDQRAARLHRRRASTTLAALDGRHPGGRRAGAARRRPGPVRRSTAAPPACARLCESTASPRSRCRCSPAATPRLRRRRRRGRPSRGEPAVEPDKGHEAGQGRQGTARPARPTTGSATDRRTDPIQLADPGRRRRRPERRRADGQPPRRPARLPASAVPTVDQPERRGRRPRDGRPGRRRTSSTVVDGRSLGGLTGSAS